LFLSLAFCNDCLARQFYKPPLMQPIQGEQVSLFDTLSRLRTKRPENLSSIPAGTETFLCTFMSRRTQGQSFFTTGYRELFLRGHSGRTTQPTTCLCL